MTAAVCISRIALGLEYTACSSQLAFRWFVSHGFGTTKLDRRVVIECTCYCKMLVSIGLRAIHIFLQPWIMGALVTLFRKSGKSVH